MLQPLHPPSTCIGHGDADARLGAQKRKSLREILVEGFWCKWAVLIPLCGGPVNLRSRSLRNPDFQGSASHDDARASRAVPPLKLFRHGQPRRWPEEARPPRQGSELHRYPRPWPGP